jgi:PD-(D/E)XK nuclease superfamily
MTAGNLAEARDRFRALVKERLASAPLRDRPLLEVRLLGSPARAGVIDMLGGIEVERNVAVVERLLELRLDGACEMTGEAGTTRSLNVSGVADRIDLLADGTFDLLDYKLGRAPNLRHTVQLPVYSAQAATALSGRHGIDWKVRDAAYVPFAGPERLVTLRVAGKGVAPALAAGQQRFLAAVDGIEAGRFPPRPADPIYCSTCAYASVCRKDYHSGD